MKNRAKCKLCQCIIESFHPTDYVICKCGHIAVDGGDALKCYAMDWNNFMRVDDEGNEIVVKVENTSMSESTKQYPGETQSSKPTHQELLSMLEEMIKNIEKLPQSAMSTPINHYDFCSALLLFLEIFRSSCKADNKDIVAS